MMQECAAKWRNMSIEEKGPYQALADVDKERWQTEKAAEKKPKDQWRPKRPPSAYFLFLRDFRENWKLEHEDELKEEAARRLGQTVTTETIPEVNGNTPSDSAATEPGNEQPKDDSTATAETENSTENPETPDEESSLQIDESASNNNKPPEASPVTVPPIPEVPPVKINKKDKVRKTSRVVVRSLLL